MVGIVHSCTHIPAPYGIRSLQRTFNVPVPWLLENMVFPKSLFLLCSMVAPKFVCSLTLICTPRHSTYYKFAASECNVGNWVHELLNTQLVMNVCHLSTTKRRWCAESVQALK